MTAPTSFDSAFAPRAPGMPPVGLATFVASQPATPAPGQATPVVHQQAPSSPLRLELEALPFTECLKRDELELARQQEAVNKHRRIVSVLARRIRAVSARHAELFGPLWENIYPAGAYAKAFPAIHKKSTLYTWAAVGDLFVAEFCNPADLDASEGDGMVCVAIPLAYLEPDGDALMVHDAATLNTGDVSALLAVQEWVKVRGLPSRERVTAGAVPFESLQLLV
jgi:hypothetical protein